MSVNYSLYRFKTDVINDLQNLSFTELKQKYESEFINTEEDYFFIDQFGTELFNFYDMSIDGVDSILYPDDGNDNLEVFSREKCKGLSDDEYKKRIDIISDYHPVFFEKQNLIDTINVYKNKTAESYGRIYHVNNDDYERYMQRFKRDNIDLTKITESQLHDKIMLYKTKDFLETICNMYAAPLESTNSPFNVNNVIPFGEENDAYEGIIKGNYPLFELGVYKLMHILHIMDWTKYKLVVLSR